MLSDLDKARLKLKELREKSGYSLREFSKRLDISHGYLSNIESGKRKLPPEVLVKAANVLGIDMVDFFKDETTKPTYSYENEELYIFGEKLKKDGITLEEAARYIDLAKQILRTKD